ncbi:hypothetical protein [Streptomyces hydrogenans]|uniref:hypothetical protein n=1 Tax=Streptomyces hydrogenans TaxID=1873719 RepID=UPI003EB9629E
MNRLSGRWASALPAGPGGTVFSAACVWPLPAFLADGAAGPARDELEDALGVRADGALAVHRTSRLVLSAGWVADPVEYPGADAY